MSGTWSQLAWRATPVVLVLAWFLVLIGGYGAGGLVHVLLLVAILVFGYQLVTDRSR